MSDPVTDNTAGKPSDKFWSADRVWSVARIPLHILLVGLSILLLAWLSSRIYVPLFNHLFAALSDTHGPANPDQHPVLQTIVALLIFLVGLSFAGFLWWVVERYFALISSKNMTAEQLSDLKDLPMGLPEGSVRSVLALIVAVIGIPLLAFSKVINLDSAIGGYLNGIITGVFGFYFGTRSGISSSQAISQITDAKSRADQAEDDRDAAQEDAQKSKSLAEVGLQAAGVAARAAGFGSTMGKLNRELGVASTILNVIEPALPAGILPAGLATAVSTAQTALDAVQGVTKDNVTEGQQSLLQAAVGTLLGAAGSALGAGGSKDAGGATSTGSSAALGALLKTAAPMLSTLGIPGVGEITALVALLSVGMKLGSQEYGRWRARVLAAPLAHGLIEFGTVTPDDIHAALLDAPLFAKAFAEERDRPGFDASLADAVLRDDAIDRLWQRYGTGAAGQPAVFADRAHLAAGLTEFNQALLAARSAHDMPPGLPDPVTATLAEAKHPDIRAAATQTFTRDILNKIVNTASKASTPAAGTPKNTQAAFDALVTLVGHSRQNGIDLIGSLAEVTP